MQSYCDLNLRCGECKSNFTSASKLLQHFVEHVKEEQEKRSGRRQRGKRKSREQVSESSSESCQSQTLSAASDSLSDRDSCKLAKFDLQERLESCVEKESAAKNIKQEPIDRENTVSETIVPDEYSPLKFCQITMEESDYKPDVTGSPHRIPSRKQPLPKKIERNSNTFRKLAPKPEGIVVNNESPGKKKYACHLCTKVFGWSTDLKRHILVHTGERPFKCENCQATFTRNFLLQKHQSKVHPCKPKLPEVSPVTSDLIKETKIKVEPLKTEEKESNEDDEDDDRLVVGKESNEEEEDDEDEDRLVITEPEENEDDKLPNANNASDTWHLMPTNSDSRCSDLKHSEMFNATPIKVLTM